MFGLSPTELILTGAVSLGLMVFGGVCTLVFISRRGSQKPIRKDS
jgi:hypothetical protein